MKCQACLEEAEKLTPSYLPTERKKLELCDACAGRDMLDLLGLLYVQEWRLRYRPQMEKIR